MSSSAAGDESKVVATDPSTGETSVEPVLDTITTKGDKKLVQLTIDANARLLPGGQDDNPEHASLVLKRKQPKSGVVIATDHHPFWVAGDINTWVKATDLKPGMWLRTSAGTYVQITATNHTTAAHQRVHNLTIAIANTYYVEAGETPVLVHNCGNTPPGVRWPVPPALAQDQPMLLSAPAVPGPVRTSEEELADCAPSSLGTTSKFIMLTRCPAPRFTSWTKACIVVLELTFTETYGIKVLLAGCALKILSFTGGIVRRSKAEAYGSLRLGSTTGLNNR
ncbi:hypothetical protein GCM10022254_14550 [Actinomadura meridiana]|uniref:Intein C-terminal splicing domain-containing protein n=1 Tax=Actinomadura meridiana TaxID=559626 RepID=A0ABP8BVI1_9ACTN